MPQKINYCGKQKLYAQIVDINIMPETNKKPVKKKNTHTSSVQAKRRLKGASPRSGVVPPKEYRWKKGQSGNPSGMPKGYRSSKATLKQYLAMKINKQTREHFEKIIGEPIDLDITFGEAIAMRLIEKAMLKGDVQASREIYDRTEGRPKQVIDMRPHSSLDDLSEEEIDKELNELRSEQQREKTKTNKGKKT